MPIYFRNTPVKQPFLFDSIGYDWYQEPMNRPKGYPHFHYLQTEQGMGQIHIQGKHCLSPLLWDILIRAFQRKNGTPAFLL